VTQNRIFPHYAIEVTIVIPMDAYRAQLAAFRRKFGREMGPDDPFFFDPDADTPQFRSPSDARHAIDVMAEMLGQAGVDAALIHAFKRTGGLFPTVTRRLSYEESIEWNAALDEYHAQLELMPRQ
jgi:hypothetical protein